LSCSDVHACSSFFRIEVEFWDDAHESANIKQRLHLFPAALSDGTFYLMPGFVAPRGITGLPTKEERSYNRIESDDVLPDYLQQEHDNWYDTEPFQRTVTPLLIGYEPSHQSLRDKFALELWVAVGLGLPSVIAVLFIFFNYRRSKTSSHVRATSALITCSWYTVKWTIVTDSVRIAFQQHTPRQRARQYALK
jgi:hypothetical protein